MLKAMSTGNIKIIGASSQQDDLVTVFFVLNAYRYECQCADDLSGLEGISNDTSTCTEHISCLPRDVTCDSRTSVEAPGAPEKRHEALIPSNRFDYPVSLNKE